MRGYWIFAVIAAFVLGVGVERTINRRWPSSVPRTDGQSDFAGIERLHKLDERVTVLSDAKALQDEWTSDAVRLDPDGAVDVGKAAIYATDVHSFADSPGFAVVSYKPDIRDVKGSAGWPNRPGGRSVSSARPRRGGYFYCHLPVHLEHASRTPQVKLPEPNDCTAAG